jgi:hypothetical protein
VSTGNPSEVFLNLIEWNSFNRFDGKQITKALRADRHLWDAVLFYRTDVGITLRDMVDGRYNADSLVLLTSLARWDTLYEIVKQWSPDAIVVVTPTDSFNAGRYEDETDCYTLTKMAKPDREDTLSSFLGAHQKDEARVVIRLWWD